MKKITTFFIALLCLNFAYSQVGIGTTLPTGALDINSSTNGLVIPRVLLTSKILPAPVVNPQGGALTVGTMVYNTNTTTGTNAVFPGFYTWNGAKWDKLNNGTQVETKQISNVIQPNPIFLPTPIPAGTNALAQSFDSSTITKTINVTGYVGNTSIVTCNVQFSHTWASDVDIYLQSPTGQIIELTTDNGGSSATTFNVTFADAGASNITTWPGGTVTGTYRPEGTLTADVITPNITTMAGFSGFSPNGTWTLHLRDDLGGDFFNYVSFSLSISTATTVTYTLVREIGPVVYKGGHSFMLTSMYSCNPLDDDGFITALTYSTATTGGAEGFVGPVTLPVAATTLNYASASPKQGLGNYWATTYNQATVTGLTVGNSYYFQLWKKGNVEGVLTSNRQFSFIANQIQN